MAAGKKPVEAGGREAILAVATKLFADKGFQAVSVRDIAKESKLNLSLVSYYFGGKEKLYMHIVEEHAQRMRSTWEKVIVTSNQRPMTRENFYEYVNGIVANIVEMRISSPRNLPADPARAHGWSPARAQGVRRNDRAAGRQTDGAG